MLGTVKVNSPLAAAGLRTAVAGTGSFAINGVTIAYDAATDSLATVLKRINASTAGVTATYDAAADRVTLANNKTGDFGVSVSDTSGGLLGALGLTGATFVAGRNAAFSVNGSPTRTSASNTLDATALGITGLSVIVNSESTQTLEVATEAATLNTAIQGFIDKYNSLQTLIDSHTKISTSGGVVSAAVLADNREVEAWSTQLRALAFGASSGATGTVKRLDDLGLDFTGTDGQLTIKDSTKLTKALLDHPTDVASYFQSATGLAAKLHGYLSTAMATDSSTQSRLGLNNIQIDKQIADIERRLASQRELLTSSFLKMQDAQSKAQSQNTYLTNTFFKNNTSN
jgi:flagellar hook-associated protein 2